MLESPFRVFNSSTFTERQCFLCAADLPKGGSREHVFPRWLLSRFDLWNEEMTLLNGTSIPYRQLTVPCCRDCNSTHLAKLEAIVERASTAGASAVAQLDPLILYQWMGKIFFGVLYRELSLSFERSDQAAGSITTPEFLEDYRVLHGFLQSIRTPVQFADFFPGTIFTLHVEYVPELGAFDFSDNFVGMTVAVRMGDLGIVACLKDNNAIYHDLFEIYQALQGVRLHPIQFDEFTALFFYRAFSLQRRGNFISAMGANQPPQIFSIPGWSLKPTFGDWNPTIYAQFLAEFWEKYGLVIEDIFFPPDRLRTYLGEFL